MVSWCIDVPGQLESSPDLGDRDWTPVAETPLLVGDRYTVTVPASAGTRFFRLTSDGAPD